MSRLGKHQIQTAGTMLILLGIVMAAAAFAYLSFGPKTYRATARIKVEKRDWIHDKASAEAQNPYNPNLAPAECQVLRSNTFFDQTIQNLGLAQEWGKRERRAGLSPDEARQRLRLITDIHPTPNSSLIAITVTSDEREEPARIANELARLYIDFRQASRKDVIRGKVASLQQRWAEQNQKVQQAQTKLDTITLDIYRQHGTNTTTLYDAESYALLKTKRIELETEFVQLRDQLKQLQSVPPSDLAQVLSSLDTETNAVLNALLLKQSKARQNLALAEADHGADSPEVRNTRASVDDFQDKIGKEVRAIMASKETDLSGRQAALEAFEEKLKHARPANETDTNLLQNTNYTQASAELQNLKRERDELQEKMDSTYADEALMPLVVTAELVDSAETPARPFSPDARLLAGALGGGGFMALVGCGMLISAQIPSKSGRKK